MVQAEEHSRNLKNLLDKTTADKQMEISKSIYHGPTETGIESKKYKINE